MAAMKTQNSELVGCYLTKGLKKELVRKRRRQGFLSDSEYVRQLIISDIKRSQ